MLVSCTVQTNVPKCSWLTLLIMSFSPDIEKFASTGQNVKLAFVFEMMTLKLWTVLSFDNAELFVAAGYN